MQMKPAPFAIRPAGPNGLSHRWRCARTNGRAWRIGLTWPRLIVAMAALLLMPAAGAQSYAYDAGGRLIRVAYPDGGGVAYEYDDSDNMTAVIPLSLPPAPVDVQVTRLSPTSARVTWQTDPSATGYVVERRRSDSEVWEEVATLPAGTTTFIDPGLQEGVDYAYRVAAVSADGRSAYSSEATFLTLPSPAISQNGIVNGASFSSGQPIAAGSIVSIFGPNLGVRLGSEGLEAFSQGAVSIPLATTLGEYSVLFDGIEAPLFFVGGQQAAAASATASPSQAAFTGQINAQVPWNVEPGSVEVVIRRESDGQMLESDPVEVAVAAVSPALFTFDFGPGRAAALNVKADPNDGVLDGSIAQPENSIAGVVTQPAKLGGVVTLYVNGLGPVDPPAVTGQNSLDALRSASVAPRVFVGNAEAQVLFAGLTPQYVGLYQINIVIPEGVIPGNQVPVRIEQGGVMSRADVTIAVRP
jgi:uncharacterized protein (TIGR03437 family)